MIRDVCDSWNCVLSHTETFLLSKIVSAGFCNHASKWKMQLWHKRFSLLTSVLRVIEKHVRRVHLRLHSEDVLITFWSEETGGNGAQYLHSVSFYCRVSNNINWIVWNWIESSARSELFSGTLFKCHFFLSEQFERCTQHGENDEQIMATGSTIRFICKVMY